MTFQIPLKKKYRWKPRSRFGAVGDDNLKRIPRPGSTGPIVKYEPQEHVLLLKEGRHKVFVHGEEAEAFTRRPPNN